MFNFYKKNKGFTLIELLACIIVLGILAVIITPTVSKIISSSKKSTSEKSVLGFIKAIDYAQLEYQYLNDGLITEEIDQLNLSTSETKDINVISTDFDDYGKISSGDFIINGYYCTYRSGDVECNETAKIKPSYVLDETNGDYFAIMGYANFFDIDGLRRYLIKSITFTHELPEGTGYDISLNNDKSVLLFANKTGEIISNVDLGIGLIINFPEELETWDVVIYSDEIISAPQDCSYFFSGLLILDSIDFNDMFETSNVTNMKKMFNNFASNYLQSLVLDSKFNTSNVTNMEGMFNSTGCKAMTTLDLGNNFDTSKVTNMSYMFNGTGYNAMTTLDLGNNFDTSKVTNMSYMFNGTGKDAMTTLDLGPLFKKISTTNTNMFSDTGKSGCIITAHQDIVNYSTQFKLGIDSTTYIDYTRGTIQASYTN